jgi:hypothetical protein
MLKAPHYPGLNPGISGFDGATLKIKLGDQAGLKL